MDHLTAPDEYEKRLDAYRTLWNRREKLRGIGELLECLERGDPVKVRLVAWLENTYRAADVDSQQALRLVGWEIEVTEAALHNFRFDEPADL